MSVLFRGFVYTTDPNSQLRYKLLITPNHDHEDTERRKLLIFLTRYDEHGQFRRINCSKIEFEVGRMRLYNAIGNVLEADYRKDLIAAVLALEDTEENKEMEDLKEKTPYQELCFAKTLENIQYIHALQTVSVQSNVAAQ